MKLTINIDEVGDLINQLLMYSESCDHTEIDSCCVHCRAKIVIHHWDEGELELKNETQ